MANDRMYIRCKGCGEKILLAKTFGNGYEVRATEDNLNDFFYLHSSCNRDNQEMLKYQDFELVYESQGF